MDGDVGAIERAGAAARQLAERFDAAGHSLYLVGGVVRDQFLDRQDSDPDLDCTTDARPDRIQELVRDIADPIWTQGERFGTIGCRIGSRVFEITTHRADAYDPDSRKPEVAFGDSIEDDLARRDFTVNAMAVDLADGSLVDPFGGRADLSAGVLRTPLDPAISFSEDPLRMLRAARFIAGYGLTPTPDLTSAVTRLVDRIDIVSAERITDELEKLLLLPDPGPGVEFMVSTGLWPRLFGDYDVTTAGSRAARVAAVAPVEAERWAALASVDGGDPPADIRLSNARRAETSWLLRVARAVMDEMPSDDRALRDLGRLVPSGERLERAVDFVRAVVAADGADDTGFEELSGRTADLRAREPDFDDPRLPIDGDEVMTLLGVGPGPEVGRAIERLHRHRVEFGPFGAEEAADIVRDG